MSRFFVERVMAVKKRLICIIASAILFAGCADTPESSESPEYTTNATTVPITATSVSSAEPVTEPQDGGEAALGGVVLTDEHKELRKLVSGAKEFCDFEELGIAVTKCEDFVKPALIMGTQNEDFDADYTRRGFGKVLGYDDGNFYFSIETQYGETTFVTYEQDGYIVMMHPPEILTQAEYRYEYYCLDCDSGELSQIYSPDEDYAIHEISNEAMLLKNDDLYKVIYRESGEARELPEEVRDTLLINDMLFFTDESNGYARLYFWTASPGNGECMAQGELLMLQRGVRNVVYLISDYRLADMMGNEYLMNDPWGRVCDYVTDTYYHCTAMTERNVLGWRTRLSIMDYDYEETVIGYVQTAEQVAPLDVAVKIHATKDGIIFLKLPDTQPIILLGEQDDFNNMKAAFLPEDILPDYYTVLCDHNRLYFYDNAIDGNPVVTLSRENGQGS